jgi:hypothetical protein
MGMSGLAVEAGNGYTTKVRNQRVADLAAIGAAQAYKNGGQSADVANQVALDIVVANGLPASSATVQVPVTVNGTSAVQVEINTTVPIRLASVLTNSPSYNVRNSAAASLVANNVAPCVVALSSSSTAVSATGGTNIDATGCAINTNGTIYSSNGNAKVTAKQMAAQAIDQSGGGVTTTPTANNWTLKPNRASDNFKSDSTLQNDFCLVNQMTGFTDPDYTGGNRNCANPVITPDVNKQSGTADWTLAYVSRGTTAPSMYETGDSTCVYIVPPGNYTIKNLKVNGGCSVTFQGGAGYTITIDSIDMSGKDMTIGDGKLTVNGDFNVNGNNPITIGNGAHSFGSLTIGGGKKIDIGSGNFNLSAGVSAAGGAYLRVAIGKDDTVTIGNTNGVSISVGGSSQVCFTATCGAPTAAAGKFSADGTITQPQSGGTIVFPKSVTHVIHGDLSLTAAATFGPGLYLISGNFSNGTGCNNGCVMSGVDVTFVMGGTFNFAGGSYFDLAAPTAASDGYGITNVLFATKSSSATSMSGGANGKVSGLIYAPNSAFSSSGGTSISANGGKCMMVVVNTISVSGSGTVKTTGCTNLSTSTSGTVALIQ